MATAAAAEKLSTWAEFRKPGTPPTRRIDVEM
jgi:hypothetical protein